MTEAAQTRMEARVTTHKLGRLADRLNTAYNVELALVVPDRRISDDTQCLVVHRALRVDDVVIAVSIGYDTGVPKYDGAAFTCTAWFEYGDPFVTDSFHDSAATACWVQLFVPPQPTV